MSKRPQRNGSPIAAAVVIALAATLCACRSGTPPEIVSDPEHDRLSPTPHATSLDNAHEEGVADQTGRDDDQRTPNNATSTSEVATSEERDAASERSAPLARTPELGVELLAPNGDFSVARDPASEELEPASWTLSTAYGEATQRIVQRPDTFGDAHYPRVLEFAAFNNAYAVTVSDPIAMVQAGETWAVRAVWSAPHFGDRTHVGAFLALSPVDANLVGTSALSYVGGELRTLSDEGLEGPIEVRAQIPPIFDGTALHVVFVLAPTGHARESLFIDNVRAELVESAQPVVHAPVFDPSFEAIGLGPGTFVQPIPGWWVSECAHATVAHHHAFVLESGAASGNNVMELGANHAICRAALRVPRPPDARTLRASVHVSTRHGASLPRHLAFGLGSEPSSASGSEAKHVVDVPRLPLGGPNWTEISVCATLDPAQSEAPIYVQLELGPDLAYLVFDDVSIEANVPCP